MTSFVNYWKMICKQLAHMQLDNYVLIAISFLVQIWILLSAPITWITALTCFGTLLGTTCVVAINSSKSVNGWLGIISGICFIIIGFSAKNYLSIGEQLAYMATLDVPVLCSVNWNKNLASKIRKFTWENWIQAIGFTLAVFVVSALVIGNVTSDPRPWFDGLAFSISLTGGLVCFLRYNNQYFWWIASSVAQFILWFVTWKQGSANLGMLVNTVIYFTNDILALTVSPWYNKKVRKQVIAKNKKYDM